MRPGKAEAMRDMCNPKLFGKHIHMYYTHFPFISVQLHMFIVHEDLRSCYQKDLFSPIGPNSCYKKQKVQNRLSARAQGRDNSEALLFSDCNAYPCMI